MADWTTPKTWSVNEIFTSTDANTYIRDNTPIYYTKTTAKAATNTTTETDLLNGEVTLAAGVMGSNRRLTAWLSCDYQVSGGSVASPRFKIKLDSTVCIDTGISNEVFAGSATRIPLNIQIVMQEMNATNAQEWTIEGFFSALDGGVNGPFTVGEGFYRKTTATSPRHEFYGRNNTTVDMTAARNFAVTVTNGSSTNCETKLYAAKIAIGT